MRLDDPGELEQPFAAELQRGRTRTFSFTLEGNARQFIGVLGIIQIALQHPALAADDDAAGQLVLVIEHGLGDLDPATSKVCALGWGKRGAPR